MKVSEQVFVAFVNPEPKCGRPRQRDKLCAGNCCRLASSDRRRTGRGGRHKLWAISLRSAPLGLGRLYFQRPWGCMPGGRIGRCKASSYACGTRGFTPKIAPHAKRRKGFSIALNANWSWRSPPECGAEIEATWKSQRSVQCTERCNLESRSNPRCYKRSSLNASPSAQFSTLSLRGASRGRTARGVRRRLKNIAVHCRRFYSGVNIWTAAKMLTP